MKNFIKIVVLFFLGCSLALADDIGTVVQVEAVQGPVTKCTFTWTSGTNNNSVAADGQYYVRGELLRVVFVPGTGTVAPTGSYTATLKDQNGIDLLAGRGSAVSSNTVVNVSPALQFTSGAITNIAPFAVNDILTLSVTNCGNSKSGSVITYTR